jgi:hypothetical protein
MLSKFLDPKNDVAFRKIFGSEKNKDILLHFINDMIKFRGSDPIIEVTFLTPIQDPEIISKKSSIVDILTEVIGLDPVMKRAYNELDRFG